MKILLATSTVTPTAGIPSYNRELCSLLGEDNEMHLLVGENLKEYKGYSKVYSTVGYNIYDYDSCMPLLEKINEEHYDVIINSNSHVISLFAPYIDNSTRIITISHSLGTMDCDNAVYNNKYVDNIIALSNNCKKYILKRFGVKADKISVIFNSVAEKEDADIIREKKIKNEKLSIVFAGGTASSKSPDIVIPLVWELCKTNLQFEFYWLGIITPPLKRFQPFKDVRKILPKDERIIVTGPVPRERAAEIIANCNIFLAPSRREGFPMALLEAMRVGCIPIVSDYNIANKEVIKDGINGFVIPHRYKKMFEERIKDIICNYSMYNGIYEESYKTFEENLNFSVWNRNINKIFKDGIQTHKKRKKSMTKFHYAFNVFFFRLLDKYNFVENHIKEVLPCAIKFYIFYKRYGNWCFQKQ